MTNLEQALANILELIEKAEIAGNSLALVALLRRKDVICAALAAPEQSWHDPHEQAPDHARRQRASEQNVLMPLLSSPCI